MPDIVIFASPEGVKRIAPYFDSIARCLREVTANTLPDLNDDPNKVSVCLVPWAMSQNMADLQIVGLASYSPIREKSLENWRNILRQAIKTFLDDDEPASNDLKRLKIEVWPIMPIGSWGAL